MSVISNTKLSVKSTPRKSYRMSYVVLVECIDSIELNRNEDT